MSQKRPLTNYQSIAFLIDIFSIFLIFFSPHCNIPDVGNVRLLTYAMHFIGDESKMLFCSFIIDFSIFNIVLIFVNILNIFKKNIKHQTLVFSTNIFIFIGYFILIFMGRDVFISMFVLLAYNGFKIMSIMTDYNLCRFFDVFLEEENKNIDKK